MRFCTDEVKKVLACDQIAEGLEFDKRPSNQELVFGHILLMHEEGKNVVPRDLVRLIGCSSETLRLMLRKAEKGGFLKAHGRPDYEIVPLEKLLSLVFKVSQEWLLRNRMRLLPFSPSVRSVYLVTQTFDMYSRHKKLLPFVFKSPLKRGISFFVLDREKSGGVELKKLRHNFPIDHESLRQFVNIMVDAGYFKKHRKGKKVLIRPTSALTEIANMAIGDLCGLLNQSNRKFAAYNDFIGRLDEMTAQARRAEPMTAS
jgi:hypothetical protein